MAKRRPSGDGMVRKRDDGRWEGRIVVGHKKNGDSIFRYVYAPTQKELSAKLRQHIDSYQGADLTEQGRMTLSEWLDQWLEDMADTLRPNTLRNYRSYIENHIRPGLGDKQLARITPKDVQRFYEKLSDRQQPDRADHRSQVQLWSKADTDGRAAGCVHEGHRRG